MEFLCFSTVTDGISLRYLSDSRDGTARDLYNLVRTLSSVVNLRGKYELRRVAVDAVHVDHWRAMFPGMKVSAVFVCNRAIGPPGRAGPGPGPHVWQT